MNAVLFGAYALSFLNIPYIYGSKNPTVALDCSGLVSEILKANRMIGPHETLSSQDLFDRFNTGTPNVFKIGTLVFYGQSATKIEHVAMLVDTNTIIESAGGDSTTTSLEIAQQMNAFVKLRDYRYRSDLVAVIRPRYYWDSGP